MVVRTGSPDKEVRTTKACDAIFESDTLRVAVEHTTLDSYRNQRFDTAQFQVVLGSLEERLEGKLPDDVDVDIRVHAVPLGYSWEEGSRTIESWILSNITLLPYERRIEVQIPGVPFPIGMRRERTVSPGRMFAMRMAPADLRQQRVEVLVERMKAKSDVLSRYKGQGFRTLLIVESDDIALTSRGGICEDFQEAVKAFYPDDIDDILLVETDTQPWCVTPLKAGAEIMTTAQPSWPTAPGYPHLIH